MEISSAVTWCQHIIFIPVIVTVTVAESYENEEEDEKEEQAPGHTIHDGRGDGYGDRVHHDS